MTPRPSMTTEHTDPSGATIMRCDGCGWAKVYDNTDKKAAHKAIARHVETCGFLFDQFRCACDLRACPCAGNNPECRCGHGLG